MWISSFIANKIWRAIMAGRRGEYRQAEWQQKRITNKSPESRGQFPTWDPRVSRTTTLQTPCASPLWTANFPIHPPLRVLGSIPRTPFLGCLVMNHLLVLQDPTPMAPPMWDLPFTHLPTCTTELNKDLNVYVHLPAQTQYFLMAEIILNISSNLHCLKHSNRSINFYLQKEEITYGK